MRRSGTSEALADIEKGLALVNALPTGEGRDRHELSLELALGDMLRAAKGTAALETEQAFGRARELAEKLGDEAQLLRALNGLALFHYRRADLQLAFETGSQFLKLAANGNDPIALIRAHEALGYVSFAFGQLTVALGHMDQAIEQAHARERKIGSPSVLSTSAPIYAAWALLLLGYAEQASQRCQDGLALAVQSRDPFAIVMGIGNATTFSTLLRDNATALEQAERLIELSHAKRIRFWRAIGELYKSA